MSKVKRNRISVLVILIALVLLVSWELYEKGFPSISSNKAVVLDECEVAVYFSPHGGGLDAIVSLINDAERTLDCCIYTFTSRDIANALVKAHELGVSVRIITDESSSNSKYSKKRFLDKRDLPIRIYRGDGLMHNKFMIVDSTTVLTGSFNWTASAENKNYENVIIIKSRELAEQYEAEFGDLWRRFK